MGVAYFNQPLYDFYRRHRDYYKCYDVISHFQNVEYLANKNISRLFEYIWIVSNSGLPTAELVVDCFQSFQRFNRLLFDKKDRLKTYEQMCKENNIKPSSEALRL